MSFSLSKAEQVKRTELVEQLRTAKGKLEDAVAVYNDGLTKLRDELRSKAEEYNTTLVEVRGWTEDIFSQADSDYDDKSDKWRDSDAGEAAQQWKSEWENLGLDEIELELADDISLEDFYDHADILEAAPVDATSE